MPYLISRKIGTIPCLFFVPDSLIIHGFHYVDWKRATQLALPLKEEYGDFVSVNRTWYRINEANVHMMADKAYFYENDSGDFVCVGSRFQHGVKLFVLMLGGNYQNGLDFAVNLAHEKTFLWSHVHLLLQTVNWTMH